MSHQEWRSKCKNKVVRSVGSDCSEIRSEEHVRHTHSTCAALIGDVSHRDLAKDADHFDDILGTSIYETSKSQSWVCKIRDEQKTLPVKKLMPKSLLIHKFRDATVTYDELITALENIIIDKIMTADILKTKESRHVQPSGHWNGRKGRPR